FIYQIALLWFLTSGGSLIADVAADTRGVGSGYTNNDGWYFDLKVDGIVGRKTQLCDIWNGKVTSSDVYHNSATKVRSFDNIPDAKEFGRTTEKDGTHLLVKEVVDHRTDQTESESNLLLNGPKLRLSQILYCYIPL
ncbi:hypothetical protein Tco_1059487, partial [Tanacetum coccineum]